MSKGFFYFFFHTYIEGKGERETSFQVEDDDEEWKKTYTDKDGNVNDPLKIMSSDNIRRVVSTSSNKIQFGCKELYFLN